MVQSAMVVVVAGIEDLEWLKLPITRNMSRDYVEDTLLRLPGFEGFRYATIAETKRLFSSYYAGVIDEGGNIVWMKGAAQAADRFLADFGITTKSFLDQPTSMDLDNEYVSYNLLLHAYFFCGEYSRNLPEAPSQYGSVGEALYGLVPAAGFFTLNGLVGTGHANPGSYSSLLVKEHLAAPTGLKITA